MLSQKSIIAILLSTLVLSTSLGAVVYKHFCGDYLQDFSLTKIEKHCVHHTDHSDQLPPCHQSKADSDKECCKTEKQEIKSDETKVASETKSAISKGGAIVSVFYVLVNYLFSNPLDERSLISYSSFEGPPIPYNRALQVLLQKFII